MANSGTMQDLSHILYMVSTALLEPVIVCLLGLTAWVLVVLGGFLRESWERWRFAARRARLLPYGTGSDGEPGGLSLEGFFREVKGGRGYLAYFCSRVEPVQTQAAEVRRLFDELELDVAARLSRLVLGARLGPMLGLMGTLIPLGPALIGLAQGKLDELAANLVVAFSTTVVGLLAGVLSYAMLHARRTWYARDLGLLEYLCERLDAGLGDGEGGR